MIKCFIRVYVLLYLFVCIRSAGTFGNIVTDVDDEEVDATNSNSRSSGNLFNFASATAGAVVLDSSPSSAKGYYNLLNSDKDKYSISPCSEKRWVVIGLSEDIQITSVVLANYERYSSLVKDFQLLASGSYPTSEWIDLGTYTAEPKLGEQTFNITQLSTGYTRYLRVRFQTHYLDEALCTLSQIKVHGLTIIASLKQEVELAQDHFDILQKLNQEEKAKMTGGSSTTENQTITTTIIPAPSPPEHSLTTDSSTEQAESSVELINVSGGGDVREEVSTSTGSPDSLLDAIATSIHDASMSAPDTVAENINVPGDIKGVQNGGDAENSDIDESLRVDEATAAFADDPPLPANRTLSSEAQSAQADQEHTPVLTSSPEDSQLPASNTTQSDVDSIEVSESESASVVYSALQEMDAPSFNVSTTPTNSSTFQKLQELIFSGSSIFKRLKLSPTQLGMLESFVSFVHSQRDEQASTETSANSSSPSDGHEGNSSHREHAVNSSEQVSFHVGSDGSNTVTLEQSVNSHLHVTPTVGDNGSSNSTEGVEAGTFINSSTADPLHVIHSDVGVDAAARAANDSSQMKDQLVTDPTTPTPDPAQTVLDTSKQTVAASGLSDLPANRSSNTTEESGAPNVLGEKPNVIATDIISPSLGDSSSNASTSDASQTLLSNQVSNTTAAAVAAANLSSLASFNCHDMMTFAEFQSKTLAKLSNKTEEYSGSSGFAALNKDHNVFRALMQRIKNLEMNYILSEMYISQMSECMKAMSKEHQALLVKHEEPFNKSSMQTQPVNYAFELVDGTDTLLPLLPAAIKAAQNTLIYLTIRSNSSGSSGPYGPGVPIQEVTGRSMASSPWFELFYIAVSNGLKAYRQLLLRLPLVNGHSVVQIALQAVLRLNKEYTLEIWSLFIVSIVAAFMFMWVLTIALFFGLIWMYFRKRYNDV